MSTHGTVIVGAGLAGAKACEGLRAGGYTDPIALVGDEPERPYERPGLSKEVLLGKDELSSLYVHDAEWYAENSISTHFGTAATTLNLDERTVSLENGEILPYEHLVLATGSNPRTLPLDGAGLEGVHTLRRMPDTPAIKAHFGEGKKLVIIGAGWIGLEVAAAARLAGTDVTVLEYASLPLQRVLGDTLAAYIYDLHTENGVDLRTSVSVTSITGENGHVTGVESSAGHFDADAVVIGVGAAPNTELAASAGLAVDNGVLVDEKLRTERPEVLAIGDIANARNTATGGRLRVEHWDNAMRQGELAAQTILGTGAIYDWQPYFFTDQFDFGMEYVGHGSADDTVHIRGSLDAGEFIAFWTNGERVTAAMNVNIWDVNDDLRAVVGHEVAPARLTDESVDLGDLLGS
ncbi:NAD(P)/FAD-dependent oxidoreductase [Paramicrobacterium agarici]|uniref:3-phenylpropionate/trans-cinnamate dioxygenase ferredoxin reductase subunit n=1 Tax=Paramicrobacterium agarici TaxID=630514 RepID=A0A2A9DZ89_9MICO|nr:FAD-dependent oxidoreductase [Microbacterium agarici]PFG31913.1 3-phenylpropionate/trans-cinnamate dioxygenase ferredoxin reductase subunit [Microbacterium agarici]